MGKYELALADFDRAIGLDEKDAWAIASRGETYRLMGKYELALADFDRAIGLDEKDAWAIASRGETYRLMEQVRAGAGRLRPRHRPRREVCLGHCPSRRDLPAHGQVRAGAGRLRPGHRPRREGCLGHCQRGETYRLMGKYERALADFDRAIGLDPKYAWAIASAARPTGSMGEYERALADFDRAIALDPKNAWAIASRGETYRQKGEYERALADFDQAIASTRRMPGPLPSGARPTAQKGEYELALADFDRAIASTRRCLGHCQPRRDLPAKGSTSGRWPTSTRPSNSTQTSLDHRTPSARLSCLGAGGSSNGRFLAAAIDRAREVEAKTPDDWENRLNLALYYVASGDLRAAEGLYQAAIDAGVNEGPARDAIQDLDDYLHLFPTDEAAHEMRERLQRYIEERFPKAR